MADQPDKRPELKPETISAAAARRYWRALMGNIVSLIQAAAWLAEHSPALARSLLILSQEEAGKANEVYKRAQVTWTQGEGSVNLDGWFLKMERLHDPKIIASLDADDQLDPFWGDYSSYEFDPTTTEAAQYVADERKGREKHARIVNQRKQAGFYVDRRGGRITAPQDEVIDDIRDQIIRTAGVAEMLLITDHTRMQGLAEDKRDLTHDLQMAVMPYSHPEEFKDWVEKTD